MFRTGAMDKKEKVWRYVVTAITTIAITICVVISETYNINTPLISIIGGYASIPAILLLTWRLPFSFFLWVMCFDIFAPGIGTIVNLYRTVDSYDRIIHFLSGIILAEAGRMIIEHLFYRYGLKNITSITILFAALFSCMGAGLWEIYEFTGDQLLNTKMQGNNLNTMGDIVSGFLGALVYVGVYLGYKYYEKNRDKKDDII
ncbi:MAG: hypothetical protein ACK5MV_01445 [Aminipila sp.]